MVVIINIPERILNKYIQDGFTYPQIKNVLTAFLEDLVDNPYNQFFENFEIWLDNLEEEEFEEILKNK